MTFIAGVECGMLVTVLLAVALSLKFRSGLASFFERIAEPRKRRVHVRRHQSGPYSLTQVQRDVVEALIGQGLRRREAEGCVRKVVNDPAMCGYPDSWSFELLFKAALLQRNGKQVVQ